MQFTDSFDLVIQMISDAMNIIRDISKESLDGAIKPDRLSELPDGLGILDIVDSILLLYQLYLDGMKSLTILKHYRDVLNGDVSKDADMNKQLMNSYKSFYDSDLFEYVMNFAKKSSNLDYSIKKSKNVNFFKEYNIKYSDDFANFLKNNGDSDGGWKRNEKNI